MATTLEMQVEIMRAAGLRDDEILSLARLKRRIDNGQVDDLTIEHKRLSFAKWLYEKGKITEISSSHGEITIGAQRQAAIFRGANRTGK